jgi:tetratricopeptide (TPR) repeat protein
VTTNVIGAISPRLEQAEIERAKHKPTEKLAAYDYFLRGMANIYQGTKQANLEALQNFQQAVGIDPDFATAYGMCADCYVWRKANGWTADPEQEIVVTEQLARKAAKLGFDDAVALSQAGFALAFVVGALDDGAALIDRAVVLNPNQATAWRFSTRVFLGAADLAIEHLVRLSPLDPLIFIVQNGIVLAHFFAGRYEEALSWAQKALRRIPIMRRPSSWLRSARPWLGATMKCARRSSACVRSIRHRASPISAMYGATPPAGSRGIR